MKYFPSMYYVAIAALFIVAVVKYIGHGFPVNLVVAVLTTSLLDLTVKTIWLKRKPTLPQSAIITGLIIGTVAMSAPVLGVFVASVLAMFSKFVIRLKGAHIFNPAVFGVVITTILNPSLHGGASNTPVHGASQIAEGFGPGGLAVPLILAPLLLFANWRARKLWVSIPYLIATAFIFNFTELATLKSLNFQEVFKFLELMPWYFAFIIVSEPRTSPYVKKEEAVFGVGVAILSVLPLIIFGFYSHVTALGTLLLGNLIYAIYRVTKR